MPVPAAPRFSRCIWLTVLVVIVMAATPARMSRTRTQPAASGHGRVARAHPGGAVAGSRSDFLALGTLKPDAPEVRAFLDRWFVAGTTAAELRERDRLPRQAAARGSRSSSRRSSRPDPRDASPPGGSTSRRPTRGWQITGATTLSVVEGLFRLSLSQGRQFKAHDLVVRAEDLELRLPDGYVFVAEAAGRITAAVLVGRGEMIFKPSPETEQRQIKLFAGHEELKTPFSTAFIRLSPGDSDVNVAPTRPCRLPPPMPRRSPARARSSPSSYRNRSDSIWRTSVESRGRWCPRSATSSPKSTRARFGTLTYTQSGNDPEDITVFDRSKRRNISVYASKARSGGAGNHVRRGRVDRVRRAGRAGRHDVLAGSTLA